ncbi:MAG TPA: ATP-binding protein [Caulobacteraceae bacterium]
MQKLIFTLVAVAIIVVAAVAGDYITNTYISATPLGFTPLNTGFIAAFVGAPVTYFLIGQRIDIQRVKEQLSLSIAGKDDAAVEIQLRRREAEAAQAEAEAALIQLRESEARYRMLTDRATDIIVRYNTQGVIEFASPSVREMGYEPEALIGRNLAELTHPADQSRTRELQNEVGTGRTLAAHERDEIRARRADGEWIWLQGNPAPIFDGAGQVIGAVTVLRDVTARRQVEDALRHKQQEAEAAVMAKSDFLANMTHELRTPLNAIIGFSGLLRQSSDLTALDSRKVDLIMNASQALLGVVNDVLDFSKLEAGAIELDHHPFDPKEIAESTVALLAGQAATRGLSLSVESQGLEGPLLGDGARLRQVLLNFLSNAIKFTLRGEIRVNITQAAESDRRRLRMEVRDGGIGVPQDQIEAIFGRFTQADASVSRQYGGTGLGLAICKRIIEALDGEIGASSTLGEGSTFWFEVLLPVAGAPAHEATSGGEPIYLDQALRLLVVDDNAVNRELISALLVPFDLMVETAEDGVEAVEAVSREHFDLILMDVQMPNMDGLTATRRIRADAAANGARRVPIIAMTANVLPEQVARCLEAGMDDHLGKPINPHSLLEALERWSTTSEEAEEVSG